MPTLYYGDNLGVMREHLKDASVDLIERNNGLQVHSISITGYTVNYPIHESVPYVVIASLTKKPPTAATHEIT